MPDNKSTDGAATVRALVAATGMTRFGVYKALRENRTPRNPLIAKAWAKALAVVARERSARVVGKAHRSGSCPHRSRAAGRKGGRA